MNGTVDQDDADAVREAVAATGIEGAGPRRSSRPPARTASSSDPTARDQCQTRSEVVDIILETIGHRRARCRQEEIGASWGRDVAKRSLTGLIVFLVLVVLFIWAYFREWKMSVAALVALVHDVIITVGVYALSGFEVTPATVTGLLTILGFSLYDTVVVFDKVRENTKNLRSMSMTYAEAANLAVNQTLVRSINTSIVALIPVGAILYVGAVQLGNGSLKDLASLFVGMAAGTYSSIFIATPLLAHMKQGETANKDTEKRLASKRRHEADRYASVPVFTEDMAVPTATNDPRLHEDPDEHEVGPRTGSSAAGPDRPGARRTRSTGRSVPAAPPDAQPTRSRGRSGARSQMTALRDPSRGWSSTSPTSRSPGSSSRTSPSARRPRGLHRGGRGPRRSGA